MKQKATARHRDGAEAETPESRRRDQARRADRRAHEPRPYHIPRYIAVETEKNAQDAPGTRKAVMIWDTQSQEIVGNNVYDIGTAPAVGSNSRFETFSAEYVGAGL